MDLWLNRESIPNYGRMAKMILQNQPQTWSRMHNNKNWFSFCTLTQNLEESTFILKKQKYYTTIFSISMEYAEKILHTWALWTEKGYPSLHKDHVVYPALPTRWGERIKIEDQERSSK